MSRGSSYLLKRCALVCAAAAPFMLLNGCAMTSSGPSDTMISQVSGFVHGGQSPIQGATVNLYVTSNTATGYGQAGTFIGTSGTDVNGNFTISPSATSLNCPAGQQAYITSAGGYPSGSPGLANSSILLMAALGDCSNISASTRVIINEVTTVAAAYALSGFMTTSGSGASLTANVSAPAANRAASGSISAAAGLPHAFLNAASLASYVTGTANSSTANISVGGTTVNGSVPLAEINSLGDIMQACVNGATGNSSCVSLFGFTPSISGVAPTNTLQSMINLARNPYPSAAAMNATTGLFGIVPSSGAAFVPELSANPPDWSLAIVYRSATAFPAQYFTALDANDTAYAGSNANAKIVAISAYGVSTPSFTAGSLGTSTRQVAPDALGNVWVTGLVSSGTSSNFYQYSASAGGAPTVYTVTATSSQVYGLAVDKANNVWVSNAAAVTPNIIEYQYTAGSPATYAPNYTATAPGGFEPVAISIDANQNIWTADYFTNGTLASVLANLTPASTASYTTSGTTITPISATFANSAIKPIGVTTDASGNAWYGITGTPSATTTGTEEVIPNLTGSVITSLTPQSLVASATLGAGAVGLTGIDGAGTVYLSDNSGGGAVGIHAYSTVAVSSSNTGSQILSPPSGYLACYLATPTTTTCGTGSSSAVYNPRGTVIDSTGSAWAGITSGGFAQLIGLGAPSWPLLQTGKPGLSPGSSTVTPLP